MVDTSFVLLGIKRPVLLKQKRKQELNLFWQLFSALSRGLSHPAERDGISRLQDILGLHI